MTTEAEVHAACDTLNASGEEPKYDRIRQELGNKGSWSTIKKYKDTWTAREAEVPPVPEVLTSYVAAMSKAPAPTTDRCPRSSAARSRICARQRAMPKRIARHATARSRI